MERRPENKQEWSASDCREEQGNNTIVRMRQDGTLVAVREVRLVDGSALGDGRLNGIAGSPDGSKIWVTVTGYLPGQGNFTGAALELPAS